MADKSNDNTGVVAGISAGLDFISNWRNTNLNEKWNRLNYEADWANNIYQRNLQLKMMEREDTAYQRKVADLKKAGLNPMLAVGGSGSSAGPVVSTSAPKREFTPMQTNLAEKVLMMQDVARTQAQNALTKQQIENAEAQRKGIEIDNMEKAYNLKSWMYSGMPTNAGGYAGVGASISAAIGNAFSRIGQGAKDFWDKYTRSDYVQKLDELIQGAKKKIENLRR